MRINSISLVTLIYSCAKKGLTGAPYTTYICHVVLHEQDNGINNNKPQQHNL